MNNCSRYDQHLFKQAFIDAFIEAHRFTDTALSAGASPGTYYGLPSVGRYQSGLPNLSANTFGSNRREYGSVYWSEAKFRNDSPNIWRGPDYDESQFPKITALISLVENSESFSQYFCINSDTNLLNLFHIKHLIVECVSRAFALFDRQPVSASMLERVTGPILRGVFPARLNVSMVVPIALTHIEAEHFRFTPASYIFKLRDTWHSARFRATYYGSGASDSVVSAASHAYVSTGWTIDNSNCWDALNTLSSPGAFPAEAIDKFFAALRLSTGIETGYAQTLIAPRGWAFGYPFAAPGLHGSTCRRYPPHFDDFGWLRDDLAKVTSDDLQATQRNIRALEARSENRISIAIRRLNACLTREDVEDAIIDATIGLEVLLGDEESQGISYKLRMRTAALARLGGATPEETDEAMKSFTKVYSERSAIVHGSASRRKDNKRIETPHEKKRETRNAAANLLRMALQVLIQNPKYLNPQEIDRQLLAS